MKILMKLGGIYHRSAFLAHDNRWPREGYCIFEMRRRSDGLAGC
jgi:hypothetical protein